MLLLEEIEIKIRDAILRGEFAAGERLVEADLVAKYGVSRTILREALRNLGSTGLVSYVPKKGHSVKKYSPQDIVNTYDLIKVLEGYACEISVPLIDGSSEEIKYLTHLNDVMSTACKEQNYQLYRINNTKFHARFVELTNNSILVDILQNLRARIYTFRYLALMLPNAMQMACEAHDRIIACAMNEDAHGAKIEMEKHIESAKQNLLRALANAGFRQEEQFQ